MIGIEADLLRTIGSQANGGNGAERERGAPDARGEAERLATRPHLAKYRDGEYDDLRH